MNQKNGYRVVVRHQRHKVSVDLRCFYLDSDRWQRRAPSSPPAERESLVYVEKLLKLFILRSIYGRGVSPTIQSGYLLLPKAHVRRIYSRWFYYHVLIIVHVLVEDFSETAPQSR